MPESAVADATEDLDLETMRRWDAGDPLREFRAEFDLPASVVYLDGNSLGALPKKTRQRLTQVVGEEWGQGLIRSWNTCKWIEAPQRVGDKIAKLIGAQPGEVIAADSTSVNLFKLISVALAARPDRSKVLSEPGNFPTDLYMIEGAMRSAGRAMSLQLQPAERILQSIDTDTALVLLTHVHYKTAAVHDMRAITQRAHAMGALVLWDLSHSAGAVELDLNACGVDLAVGCGYKYLNGGPGAPAFLFVARRHQDAALSPLSGWMGHEQAFEFEDHYTPASGVRRFLCGTPPMLGLLSLETGVDLFLRTDIAGVVGKSRRLSTLFIDLVERTCPDSGLRLVSPRDAACRGSHVSFAHPNGYAVMQALIERGVIGDFRAPDILRFGFTPLYTRYIDVWQAASTLAAVLGSECWNHPRYAVRAAVS